jgi:undecaprenyl diphosphate synthase
VQEITAINDKLTLNIVFNYSGKWDIVQAVKVLAKNVLEGRCALNEISEDSFEALLATHGLPDPDLFIRTSGEQRLSNFFLWSLAYSEIYFSSVCWPDFNAHEFDQALSWFASRERRFGKTSQQLLEEDNV